MDSSENAETTNECDLQSAKNDPEMETNIHVPPDSSVALSTDESDVKSFAPLFTALKSSRSNDKGSVRESKQTVFSYGLTSLFTTTIGILLILFGCTFAYLLRVNVMVSFIVTFVSVIVGTFFIGISKLIEAAEIYIMKNQQNTKGNR